MSGTSRRGLSITESSESIMRTTGEEKKPSDTPDCTGTPSRSSARRNARAGHVRRAQQDGHVAVARGAARTVFRHQRAALHQRADDARGFGRLALGLCRLFAVLVRLRTATARISGSGHAALEAAGGAQRGAFVIVQLAQPPRHDAAENGVHRRHHLRAASGSCR